VYTMLIVNVNKNDGNLLPECEVQDPHKVWKKPHQWADTDRRLVAVMEYCEGQSLTKFIEGILLLLRLTTANYKQIV
jgi:hypothetical protein